VRSLHNHGDVEIVVINIFSFNEERHTTITVFKIIFKNIKLQHVSNLTGPSPGRTLIVIL